MENKRKAVDGDDRPRQRQRRAPEAETVDGRTATAGGNRTLQELPPWRVTAATTPAAGLPSGPSSQFGGALGGGGVSGTGHGVFAPPMLQPPAWNSAPGGSQWRPPTTMTQQPLGDQAGGIAPYGVPARIGYGPNQMAHPMGGFAGGGGPGFGHFAYGDWGFSLPYLRPLAEILQMPLGSPGECTICKTPTTGLWTATTVQGILVGTPQPLCDHCHINIFAFDRPVRHLHQHLASTAVGLGAGSIPAFLASIGRYGGDGGRDLSKRLLQHMRGDPAGESAPFFGIHVPSGYGSFSCGYGFVSSDGLAPAPALSAISPWCVVCNDPMATFWDWLPMCKSCHNRACYNRVLYRGRIDANAPPAMAMPLAQAVIQAEKDRAVRQVQQSQAPARGIAIGPQRPLLTFYPGHGQPSSSAPPQPLAPSSQPAAVNARPCAHLHGSDQVCRHCYRGG